MKRSLFIVLALFALISTAWAQENIDKSEQPFRFIYIIHDGDSPVKEIVAELNKAENDAIEFGQKTMVWLADDSNEDEPWLRSLIQREENDDYKSDLENIIIELQNENANSYKIESDIENIINFFNGEHSFLDENGNLIYESMTFDFYLTSEFFDKGYAAKLIQPLYIAFDIPRLKGVSFNVRVGGLNENKYLDNPSVFGEKNYNKINEKPVLGY